MHYISRSYTFKILINHCNDCFGKAEPRSRFAVPTTPPRRVCPDMYGHESTYVHIIYIYNSIIYLITHIYIYKFVEYIVAYIYIYIYTHTYTYTYVM